MVVAVDVPERIVKRDGRVVEFDKHKIHEAIRKCLDSFEAHRGDSDLVSRLVDRVINVVSIKYDVPSVEQVQDVVEFVLQSDGLFEEAKHYILYRAEHSRLRKQIVSEEVKAAFDDAAIYFPTPLQQFQFFDKYSRFNLELGRRETWVETVDRTVDFLHELTQGYGLLDPEVFERIRRNILEMRVMPSMRLLAMAGAPARRDNTTIYNCAYTVLDSIESFAEIMTVSMAGGGIGFSVEEVYIDKLPKVRNQTGKVSELKIADSAEGWVEALRFGLHAWFNGEDIKFDYSDIRPAGSVLKTKGGRASGPKPLKELLDWIRGRILSKQGRYLRPIDAHDIACMVGKAVVSGGVRRTAMISLFDQDDTDMLKCKQGDFERENEQRWNANNSMVWTHQLTQREFYNQFKEMLDSERGEPGIFNRAHLYRQIPDRRILHEAFGTNPCGEVILRPRQFCNLSAAIARDYDTIYDLEDKVEVAAIIGTIQSLATYFPNLSQDWRKNCEEERLLGVDITGQQDARDTIRHGNLIWLRNAVVNTNQKYASMLGINRSAATTVVKPSGNTSQLVNCSSGLHARWAPYYIRNVRVTAGSPVYKVLREHNVPMAPENGQDPNNPYTYVVSFPIKSPPNAQTRHGYGAIDQCKWWLMNKENWTEHNPSVTITYREDEVLDLAKWVWDNKEYIGGMSFLPAFDAKYDQLPYIEITEDEYNRLVENFPKEIDWSRITVYESEDMTTAAQELACTAGICEL